MAHIRNGGRDNGRLMSMFLAGLEAVKKQVERARDGGSEGDNGRPVVKITPILVFAFFFLFRS